MEPLQRLLLPMLQNNGNHNGEPLAKQGLNDELPDVVEVDKEHQGNDDGKADDLSTFLGLVADGATDDGFDE